MVVDFLEKKDKIMRSSWKNFFIDTLLFKKKQQLITKDYIEPCPQMTLKVDQNFEW